MEPHKDRVETNTQHTGVIFLLDIDTDARQQAQTSPHRSLPPTSLAPPPFLFLPNRLDLNLQRLAFRVEPLQKRVELPLRLVHCRAKPRERGIERPQKRRGRREGNCLTG